MNDQTAGGPGNGTTRRQMLLKAAVGTGIVWSAPLLSSVASPAAAQSTGGTDGGTDGGTPTACIATGSWQTFTFTGVEVLDLGTITVPAGEGLQVTDYQFYGDRFEVFIDDVSVGLTSPAVTATGAAFTPQQGWDDPGYSKGCFPVTPGNHNLKISVVAAPWGPGNGAYRV